MLRLLLTALAVLASLTTAMVSPAEAATEGRLVCLQPDPEDATRPDRIVVVTGFRWMDGVVVVTGFKPSAPALPCWLESPATLLPPAKVPVICRDVGGGGEWICSG